MAKWWRDPGSRAHVTGLVLNALLMLVKFSVGFLAASDALTADGFNSAGDIFATTVAFLGYTFAKRPPDEDHHYGHGNAENLAGLVVGAMLFATGCFICLEGILALVGGKEKPPESFAVYAAIVTIFIKEGLFRYATAVGRKLGSASLLASARDHRADVLVSLTVLAGIISSRLALPWLDPLAALLVGVYIAAFALEPIHSNVAILMARAPRGIRNRIRKVAVSDPDVREVDFIRVHPSGAEYYVDMEIYLDGSLSLHESHEVAHRVSDMIRRSFEFVADVKVHVNPTGMRF